MQPVFTARECIVQPMVMRWFKVIFHTFIYKKSKGKKALHSEHLSFLPYLSALLFLLNAHLVRSLVLNLHILNKHQRFPVLLRWCEVYVLLHRIDIGRGV